MLTYCCVHYKVLRDRNFFLTSHEVYMKNQLVRVSSFILISAASFIGMTSAQASECMQEFALQCPAGQIDACLIPNANATHHFCTAEQGAAYTFLGRVNIPENSTGYLNLLNGTPAIKGFMVAMDYKCQVRKAGVVKAVQGQLLEPTKLTAFNVVGYTAKSEYSVNGGYGANLVSIAITLAPHGGPFIVDVCPVDVYARF